jgi:hypothetical protein
LKSTSVKKLPDRYVLLVSGNADGGTIVYEAVELPLTADSAGIGGAVRRGLAGYKRLTQAEEARAIELATTALFEDFDEWSERYASVAVLASDAHLKLRSRGAGAANRSESMVPIDASDKEVGAAILEAFSKA